MVKIPFIEIISFLKDKSGVGITVELLITQEITLLSMVCSTFSQFLFFF